MKRGMKRESRGAELNRAYRKRLLRYAVFPIAYALVSAGLLIFFIVYGMLELSREGDIYRVLEFGTPENGKLMVLSAYELLYMCLFVLACRFNEREIEFSARLFVHAALACLALWASICCMPFGIPAMLALPLGGYFILYYVLGIVQIPLNICYHRRGYRLFYRPFYPFYKKRDREMLLLRGAEEGKKRFFFEASGVKGEIDSTFFYVSGNRYGRVILPEFCLSAEFADLGRTDKLFTLLARKVRRYGFRAVGYRIEGGRVLALLIPGDSHYRKGRAAITDFFNRRNIAVKTEVVRYADFQVEVTGRILGAEFDPKSAIANTDVPFDREKALLHSSALVFLSENQLKKSNGIAAVFFVVSFPWEVSDRDMRAFAEEREKEGFYCASLFVGGDGSGASAQVGNDAAAASDFSNRGAEMEIRPADVHLGKQAVFFRIVGLNPALTSAQACLSWAMGVYRNAFQTTSSAYRKGMVAVRSGKQEANLAKAERIIRAAMRGIRPEEQDKDDLMFSADSTFSFDELREAGLWWLKDRKCWAIREMSPEVQRLFEVLKGTEQVKQTSFSAVELTDIAGQLYEDAKAAGAERIYWGF